MKLFYLLFAVLLVVTFVGCETPGPKSVEQTIDLAKEEAAIRATDNQWLAAAKAKDKNAGSFWSDDVVLMFPGMPPIVGRKAADDYAAGALNTPGFSITWATDKIVVAASGDMAYSTGTDTITMMMGKKLVTTKNNGMVVWKKQADGKWKAAVDIGTPAPEAAAQGNMPVKK
jgi:uncharacterized protein (TIGR02246 family)